MSASQFHRRSTQSALTPSIASGKFKAGDRVRIKSTHPLFPNWSCAIAALPSPGVISSLKVKTLYFPASFSSWNFRANLNMRCWLC
ncbi:MULTISPECIES: hypothetical protein [Chroococcidiopsis]|uniref:hypothetical protein n=1 Tax=Chroococcidiopsis TaxID=54298 RepID=UPI0002DBD3AF|nr:MULTISPECIES: hypothetical protein [Chroococcidiopsis]URD51247.1 hypothetical protein M5J74_04495 [Chroococcidiopsis sp. CCNUC1]